MNVPFRIGGPDGDEALEKKFLEEASKRGMIQLKGHRWVRDLGFSIYEVCKKFEWFLFKADLLWLVLFPSKSKALGLILNFETLILLIDSIFYYSISQEFSDWFIIGVLNCIISLSLSFSFYVHLSLSMNIFGVNLDVYPVFNRSVGGIRASLYNALSLEEANLLVSFMQEFYIQHKTVTSC